MVGEHELRAVLVLDEHHDLRVIVFFEQKGQRFRRDERCRAPLVVRVRARG